MKKITIKRAKNNQFYFTIHGLNGKVIATSETYKRKSGCHTGIKALALFFTGTRELRNDIDIIDKTK